MDLNYAEAINQIINISTDPDRYNGILNLKLKECDAKAGTATFIFDVEGEWCLNPYGGVHGGVLSSMVDTAGGIGAAALKSKMPTTTDLAVNFLKPMIGRKFYINIEYTHIGNKTIRSFVKVIDAESEVLCATAIAGYMFISGEIKGDRNQV